MPADRPAAGLSAQDPPEIRLVIPGDALAVRAALQGLTLALGHRGISEPDRGTAEIVLAEVLNNIVEHAYQSAAGEIEVTIRLGPSALDCRVADSGHPMPGGLLPAGAPPPLPPEGELAEGGYGWYLIRSLSQDLRYCRDRDRNLLCFRLAVAAPG